MSKPSTRDSARSARATVGVHEKISKVTASVIPSARIIMNRKWITRVWKLYFNEKISTDKINPQPAAGNDQNFVNALCFSSELGSSFFLELDQEQQKRELWAISYKEKKRQKGKKERLKKRSWNDSRTLSSTKLILHASNKKSKQACKYFDVCNRHSPYNNLKRAIRSQRFSVVTFFGQKVSKRCQNHQVLSLKHELRLEFQDATDE